MSSKKQRDLSPYGVSKEAVAVLSQEERAELYEAVDELEEARDKQFKKKRRGLIIAAVVLLILIIVLSWRVGAPAPAVVLAPDYAMAEIEENATPMTDFGGGTQKLEAAENGGAVAIAYSDQVYYDQAAGTLSLSYGNPYVSTQSVILQIIVFGPDGSEYLIAESGILPPGYRVETLNASAEGVTVSSGAYNGIFRLLFYNSETGERAIVNSEIPILITVQ